MATDDALEGMNSMQDEERAKNKINDNGDGVSGADSGLMKEQDNAATTAENKAMDDAKAILTTDASLEEAQNNETASTEEPVDGAKATLVTTGILGQLTEDDESAIATSLATRNPTSSDWRVTAGIINYPMGFPMTEEYLLCYCDPAIKKDDLQKIVWMTFENYMRLRNKKRTDPDIVPHGVRGLSDDIFYEVEPSTPSATPATSVGQGKKRAYSMLEDRSIEEDSSLPPATMDDFELNTTPRPPKNGGDSSSEDGYSFDNDVPSRNPKTTSKAATDDTVDVKTEPDEDEDEGATTTNPATSKTQAAGKKRAATAAPAKSPGGKRLRGLGSLLTSEQLAKKKINNKKLKAPRQMATLKT